MKNASSMSSRYIFGTFTHRVTLGKQHQGSNWPTIGRPKRSSTR